MNLLSPPKAQPPRFRLPRQQRQVRPTLHTLLGQEFFMRALRKVCGSPLPKGMDVVSAPGCRVSGKPFKHHWRYFVECPRPGTYGYQSLRMAVENSIQGTWWEGWDVRQPRPLSMLDYVFPGRTPEGREFYEPDFVGRLKQQLVRNALEPVLLPRFSPYSHAYLTGRSTQGAIRDVGNAVREGLAWGMVEDVKSFFSSITPRHIDQAYCRAHRDLDMGLTRYSIGFCYAANVPLNISILTGSVIGPLLAEVVGDHWIDHAFEAAMDAGRTQVRLIRYADDLLLLGATEEGVIRARHVLRELMYRAGFELHDPEMPVNIREQPLRWLGHDLSTGMGA